MFCLLICYEFVWDVISSWFKFGSFNKSRNLSIILYVLIYWSRGFKNIHLRYFEFFGDGGNASQFISHLDHMFFSFHLLGQWSVSLIYLIKRSVLRVIGSLYSFSCFYFTNVCNEFYYFLLCIRFELGLLMMFFMKLGAPDFGAYTFSIVIFSSLTDPLHRTKCPSLSLPISLS